MAIFAVTINLLWMSVSPSFGPYHLLLVACFTLLYQSIHPLAFMGFLVILLLPKCPTDLNYGPCPLARDWGSCVSVFISGICITASVQMLR